MKNKSFNNSYLYNFAWPKLSFIKLKIKLLKPLSRACLKSIKTQFNEISFDTDRDKINYIRNWVNTNSVHLIDAEHDTYAFNVSEVLIRLNNSSLDEGYKPHLSCGPRAYAMKAVLDYIGIKSRIIDLFGLTELGEELLKVSPHTLIEVLETDKKKWVLHDPDFNVAYANRKTKVYQSTEEMLCLNHEEKGYETAGYKIENLLNLQNTVEGLFKWGVLYRYSYDGRSSELLLANNKQLLKHVIQDMDISLLSFIKQRAFQQSIRSLGQ